MTDPEIVVALRKRQHAYEREAADHPVGSHGRINWMEHAMLMREAADALQKHMQSCGRALREVVEDDFYYDGGI